jgi:hypothetical protein
MDETSAPMVSSRRNNDQFFFLIAENPLFLPQVSWDISKPFVAVFVDISNLYVLKFVSFKVARYSYHRNSAQESRTKLGEHF